MMRNKVPYQHSVLVQTTSGKAAHYLQSYAKEKGSCGCHVTIKQNAGTKELKYT